MEGLAERKISINLLCPSISSKTIQITAFEDEKIDLGLIARVFGLQPNSIKLNGHFISRGADLIASSVTWRSLIGFFSARGFSTGVNDSDALLVHGKLHRIGIKRMHDPVDNEIPGTSEHGYIRDNKKPHGGLLTSGLNLKRKLCLEDAFLGKRSRPDEYVPSFEERNRGTSTVSRASCSFMGANMKRMRDDEIVAATPLKKMR